MEEILMPNSSIVSATVVNHSRLLEKGQTYSTSVTIGYDAPWRLIHTMLLEAAQRTANVATMPAPYVTQTSLQDFYIEYKLTVVFEEGAVRRETITALHGNIQDVFNANQVQIMSPHYIADPSAPKIVPPTENDPGLV
jgi:small-conductance mechanosensitive channel